MKLKYYLRGMGIGIILTAIVMGFALGGRKAAISDEEIIARATALGMTASPEGVLTENIIEEKSEKNEKDQSASFEKLDKEGEEISQKDQQEVTVPDSSLFEVAQKEEEGAGKNTKGQGTASENPGTGSTKENTGDTKPRETSEGEAGTAIVDTIIPPELSPLQEELDVASAGNQADDTGQSTQVETSDIGTGQIAGTTEVNTQTSTEPVATETPTATETPKVTETPKATGKTVVIPGGSDSDRVAEILFNEGFIDSALTFNRYLVDTGQDRRIRSGTKTIPDGATYEQIAGIITSG